MPFVLGAIFFLTRYFAGHSRDEAFILYGLMVLLEHSLKLELLFSGYCHL